MLKIKKYIPYIFFAIWLAIFVVLALFRDSLVDENIYIGESAVIASLLKTGIWIGNYGVGLHGFLSKLLVGGIYTITGTSVFVATFVNILFGLFSGVVLFKILRKNFNFRLIYSLLGVTLLFCSYQFFTYIPTFYRDIQALFFVLLFLEAILSKQNKWISGIYLLLLLDAKEHVFFTLAPAIIIWIFIEGFAVQNINFWKKLGNIFLNGVKLFLPSLIFLILMFTTSMIPLNVYDANILGLLKNGFQAASEGFQTVTATYNQDVQFNQDIARSIPLLVVPTNASGFALALLNGVNTIISYVGKIFYPRTFSFLSIPFIILVPAVIYSIKLGKNWIKENKPELLILPITLIFYLFVYIIRASLGRYLLPITPIIIIFFLYYLSNLKKDHLNFKILGLVTLCSAAGIYFEYSYVGVKIAITGVLILLLLIMCLSKKFNKDIFKYTLILVIALFSSGTAILASYKYGQIGAFLTYGYDRECEDIVTLVSNDEKVWINDIGWDRLPFILRDENVQNAEWKWELKDWIPKKALLVNSESERTYNFSSRNIVNFENQLLTNGVQKVIFVELTKSFSTEKYKEASIDQLLQLDILKLESKTEMNNKVVYVFEVVQ